MRCERCGLDDSRVVSVGGAPPSHVWPDHCIAALQTELAQVWVQLGNTYDIGPRSYFEREAPLTGTWSPVVMALHHVWKREPKVAALQAEIAQLKADIECTKVESLQSIRAATVRADSLAAERDAAQGDVRFWKARAGSAEVELGHGKAVDRAGVVIAGLRAWAVGAHETSKQIGPLLAAGVRQMLDEMLAKIAELEAERDHYRKVFANASDQRESAREKLAELRERLNNWAAMNDHERREKKVPTFLDPNTVLEWMAAQRPKEVT